VLAALVALQLLQAVVPAATAIATGLLVARVSDPVGGRQHILGRSALPLAVLGVVLLIGQVIGALIAPLLTLARGRIDGAHRVEVATLAVSTDTIEDLERQRIRNLVRVSAAESSEWVERTPGDAALAQLTLVFRMIGMASSAAVLAAFSPWLVPVLIVPAILARQLARRHLNRHFRIWIRGVAHDRRAKYWARTATSPAEAKELRVFGFGGWVLQERMRHVRAHRDPVWADDLSGLRRLLLQFLVVVVPIAAVFFTVGYLFAHGHGSIGQETAVLTAAWGVFASVIGIQDVLALEGAQPVIGAVEELRSVLGGAAATAGRPATRVAARPAPSAAPASAPSVRFEKVGFAYPGSGRPVLQDLELEIGPGELLAVVGLNGAGKSTMTKLLAGLYRPTVGRITVDGVDIANPAALAAWRGRLSVVFQDFVRYHLSVRDNVTLGSGRGGDPVAASGLAQAVAGESGLAEIVHGLPHGWDTPLSRTRAGGVDLSGGQWQHVALARALYAVRSGAAMLVLDEPTAHLDVRTEADLFARLTALTPALSIILISHRLSTVRQADRIVFLEGGRVVESGTHDGLVQRGGRYARLWGVQASRFTAAPGGGTPAPATATEQPR
jgi:ABC-type multidrug transport system fused ATPase/permease subunit